MAFSFEFIAFSLFIDCAAHLSDLILNSSVTFLSVF
jgi:hypothetical protein